MVLHWPQITMIVLGAIGLGVHMARHGKAKDESYNAITQVLMLAFEFWLLYEGGFFGAV